MGRSHRHPASLPDGTGLRTRKMREGSIEGRRSLGRARNENRPSYFHLAVREEQHGPSCLACHRAGHGVLGGPSATASAQQRGSAHPPPRQEHDRERGCRASPRTPGTWGSPPPAFSPARRQSQHPRPERPPLPRECSLGYHRPSAGPRQKLTAPEPRDEPVNGRARPLVTAVALPRG